MTKPDLSRHAGRNLLYWVGGAGALLGLLGALALTLFFEGVLQKALAPEQASLMQTSADTTRQSLSRALAHELPLTQLRDIEGYLALQHDHMPVFSRIELQIDDKVFASGKLRGNETLYLQKLDLGPKAPPVEMHFYLLREGLRFGPLERLGLILATGLLSAALSAALAQLLVKRALARAHHRLLARLARVQKGDFRPPQGMGKSVMPADEALAELARQLDQVNLRYALLMQSAEGLRMIDYDGSLTPEVDQVMAELPETWRFTPPAERSSL